VKLKRKWRAIFFALAMTGIIAGVAWALLGSRFLVVRSVVVTGTHLVSASQVIAAAGVPRGTPLIRVNTAQVASRVEAISQVRSAEVSKSWPDRLVIAVQERTPALAVSVSSGGFDLVDPAGVVVRWSATRPSALALYTSPVPAASLRGNPDVEAAAAVLSELPAWLRGSVVSLYAPAPDQVTLHLSDRVTVLWGGTDRAAVKAEELRVLMETHAHYYNVSAQGTVVTR
jgi:cell division protein FtsQ